LNRHCLAVAAALLLGAIRPDPAIAQKEVDLGDIVAGALTKIPVHVEEFHYEGVRLVRFPGGEAPEDILVRDLEYSDFFRVSRGPSRVGQAGAIEAVAPADARAIATATVRSSWGRRILAAELRDAKSGNRIFSKDYPLGDPPERWAIHAFSDDIVLYMTGEKGVAQTRIAFVQDYGDRREIHWIDYDAVGGEALTQMGTIVLSPSWSPSGDRLAFTSFAGGGAGVVGLSLRDGRSWTVAPGDAMSASPCWSPDGRRIAFTRSVDGNPEIFLADAGGGNLTRLTHNRAIDTSPAFSPDGNYIAFTSDRAGNPQVYVMDREGADVRRLSFFGKQNDSPDWSPKGDRIAFVSMFDGVFDICTMRPDGSDVRRLTANEGSHENPRWAPDGRHLVYSKRHRGERRIYIMAANGSGKRALTDGKGGQYNPAWSPALNLQSARMNRAGN
jgi:TolB protein